MFGTILQNKKLKYIFGAILLNKKQKGKPK